MTLSTRISAVITLSLLSVLSAAAARANFEFAKRPLFEVFYPYGLRVSLPNVPGLQLFSFHGTVNSRISKLENGQLARDVWEPKNDRWEFVDENRQLFIGDVINFWIFVQRNGVGRRYDNLSFVVAEFSQEFLDVPKPTTAKSVDTHLLTVPPQSCDCDNITKSFYDLKASHLQQRAELEELKSKVEVQTELLQHFVHDMHIGTKLVLVGQPPKVDPVALVREVITEKLNLLDLDEKILQADFVDNGIQFEMSSSIDKKRILIRAKTHLTNSKYSIIDPELGGETKDHESARSHIRTRTTAPPPAIDTRSDFYYPSALTADRVSVEMAEYNAADCNGVGRVMLLAITGFWLTTHQALLS